MLVDLSSSFRGIPLEPFMSPASSSSFMSQSILTTPSNTPFSGLVICVTGLSKVRLSESLYSVNGVGQGGSSVEDIDGLVQKASRQHSCLPVALPEHSKPPDMIEEPLKQAEREPKRRTLFGHTFYVDPDVSDELHSKVIESAAAEGANFVKQWFVGCSASHVVCEGNSIRKYLGHSSNIVTPLWVLKSAKEKRLQRLVHTSGDLARQTGILLDGIQNTIYSKPYILSLNLLSLDLEWLRNFAIGSELNLGELFHVRGPKY
ncbi:hypothetical protein BC332_21292 [Capsicum chinense]|nr:hypothetical protein BC332_21292 [Capsicum chinense]